MFFFSRPVGSIKPEVRAIYSKVNEKSEMSAKNLWNAMTRSLFFVVLPKVGASFYFYYVSDQLNDSFQLVFLAV